YFGGIVDAVIQRLTDAVMCFPSLIIIIAAVAIVGPSIYNVMIVIGLLTWPSICRLVRGEFLSLRERDFVDAARASGAKPS
ncbi:ABC transporter permease subunit, partial [Streptomyces caeruleatus]